MKIFIYKTLIVFFSTYILFQFTIGSKIRDYEKNLENLIYNKQSRDKIIEKVKDEIRSANKKENILDEDEREIFSTFLNKVRNELSLKASE